MSLRKLQFSSGFLLLCAWLLYWDRSGIVWLGLLACFLHEMGHCAVLRFFHTPITQISFTFYGAKIVFAQPISYAQEWCSAAAGPAVNLLLACLFSMLPFGAAFAGVNLSLALFNLLPVGHLDGARLLRCTAALIGSQELAYWSSRWSSRFFTLLFLTFGVYAAVAWKNLTLLLMCFWLGKGALESDTF